MLFDVSMIDVPVIRGGSGVWVWEGGPPPMRIFLEDILETAQFGGTLI